MTAGWRAQTAEDVRDAVQTAVAESLPLELVGAGSKRGFGRPVEAKAVLDLSGLSGVVDYQPEELVVMVRPGVPMAELEALLASRNQCLAFEPPDLGALWGTAGQGTVGGCVMAGQGGSRRLTAGAPRDHLLGIKAVNGFGDAFGAGGRVVKNVTGFDVPKLMAGSFGTLSAITELTLRASPAPQYVETLAFLGLDDQAATQLLSAGLGTPAQLSGAAHLPADIVRDTVLGGLVEAGASVALMRLEGVKPSVAARMEHLRKAFETSAPQSVLDPEVSGRLWKQLSDVTPFAGRDTVLWRLSTAPLSAAALGRSLSDKLGGRCYYDWGGGQVWLELPAAVEAHAEQVRAALGGRGHATLVRAPADVRATVPPFQPPAAGEEALTRRIKAQFDPRGVLNPGRMYEGV